jgi:hypothetical protein
MIKRQRFGIEFEVGDAPGAVFEIGDSNGASFEPGTPVIAGGTRDYERLVNLPEINGRTVIGDKTVAYYLQNGLIIDGGNAQGVG